MIFKKEIQKKVNFICFQVTAYKTAYPLIIPILYDSAQSNAPLEKSI